MRTRRASTGRARAVAGAHAELAGPRPHPRPGGRSGGPVRPASRDRAGGDPVPVPGTVTSGTATVGAGLVVLGISAAVYLIVTARAVGPVEFASVSTLWTLVYTFGIGAFLPFEQELGRAVAHRTGLGQGGAPVVARVAAIAAAVLLILLLAGALLSPVLVSRLFGGHWNALFALGAAMTVMAVQYVSRGVFSGSGRFEWYSSQLGIEGAARTVGCAGLFALGVHGASWYVWLLVAAPLASVVLTLPGAAPGRRGAGAATRSGPPASWAEVSVNLGWLLTAALCAQGVANAAIVALRVLAPGGAAAGQFLAAFVIARIPLFLFQAVQAALLPGLARALAIDDAAGYRRELWRVLGATGLVGAAGMAGAAAAGPEALRLAFGAGFGLGRADIVVLAAGTALYMLALVFQAGLLARRRHRDNALCWAVALGVFALTCALPVAALARVELALILSSAVAAGLLGTRLVLSARPRPAATLTIGERTR
jgi:O-antigen/teichoic acid export membrane protein